MSNLVVLRQRVCAEIEGNPTIGEHCTGALPTCGRGVADPLEICPSLTCVIVPNVVILAQTVQALLRRSAWKIGLLMSCLSWSLKVIRTNTDRSATYDFLLTFYSNYGPICYCFRNKQSKITNFAHCVINAPVKEMGVSTRVRKLEWWGYRLGTGPR